MSPAPLALDRILAALADPQRRRAVELLREAPSTAGDLAKALGLAPPAMSRALRALKDADLVHESHPPHDARVRIYELRSGGMSDLRVWLKATEALWSEQLEAFKAHLEAGD